MTSSTQLRGAVTGLIMLAAAEEEMLLSSALRAEQGQTAGLRSRSSRTTPSSASSR